MQGVHGASRGFDRFVTDDLQPIATIFLAGGNRQGSRHTRLRHETEMEIERQQILRPVVQRLRRAIADVNELLRPVKNHLFAAFRLITPYRKMLGLQTGGGQPAPTLHVDTHRLQQPG